MFVSAEDIAIFTGLKRPAAQARFLKARRIKFTIDKLTGVPQVLPVDVERHKRKEAAIAADAKERLTQLRPSMQSVENSALFVSASEIAALTGKVRPAAQARWLEASGIRFLRRGDGSIALRLAELDAHTLSNSFASISKQSRPDPWEPKVLP